MSSELKEVKHKKIQKKMGLNQAFSAGDFVHAKPFYVHLRALGKSCM